MVVGIDKATALRMHDKIHKHWASETERVRRDLGDLGYRPRDGDLAPVLAQREARAAELRARLDVLMTTDMALIVSPGQHEIEQMRRLGLDIEPHRRRMNTSQPGLDDESYPEQDGGYILKRHRRRRAAGP